MKVEQVMTREVLTIDPAASLVDAARRMRGLNVGLLPICEAGRVTGIVTDRDITVRATAYGLDPETTTLDEVMTREVVACHPDDDLGLAGLLMQQYRLRRLLVLDGDQRLVGIVSLGDLAVQGRDPLLAGRILERVCGDRVHSA